MKTKPLTLLMLVLLSDLKYGLVTHIKEKL
jgi:hypothetical protein